MRSIYWALVCMSSILSLITPSIAQSPTIALSTATAGSSLSQPTLPVCASACAQTAIGTQSCAPGDQACLCSFSTQVQEAIYKCLGASTCSESERVTAFDYYPVFCKNLNLAVETKIPTMIATASGSAPTRSTTTTTAPSLSLGGVTQTSIVSLDENQATHSGLQLPAILGIILVVILMIVGVGALLVWSFLRRRQILRRPRMDLGGEFVDPKPRPPRSKSINSEFMVQPSPIEKEAFGRTLSRSSTLVPPPPIAKDEKRSSQEKRTSARNKTLKLLLGSEGFRSSLLSSRPGSKQPSLIVPPLDIRKSQESQMRISKF